jgi:hypothetical protein
MSAQEAAAVVLAVATLVSSLASLAVALRTGQKADRTHDLVNSTAGALNESIAQAARAEGRLEGTPGVVGKTPTRE